MAQINVFIFHHLNLMNKTMNSKVSLYDPILLFRLNFTLKLALWCACGERNKIWTIMHICDCLWYCLSIFPICVWHEYTNYNAHELVVYIHERKGKRSDSVLWQKPLHQQKCQKGTVTTQTTPQKSSITQRLRSDLGRSVGVTTATQLVWLTGLRAHLPTNRNSRLIKRTHV